MGRELHLTMAPSICTPMLTCPGAAGTDFLTEATSNSGRAEGDWPKATIDERSVRRSPRVTAISGQDETPREKFRGSSPVVRGYRRIGDWRMRAQGPGMNGVYFDHCSGRGITHAHVAQGFNPCRSR